MSDKRRSRAAAPMAAEDGLLLLQSQALAEEEEAKTKGEMLTRFLKDKLAKEERSSTLNLHKLRTQWRTVLREVKDKELRQDIEILSQTFARVMDCKDSVIESLATDLEEAEEQHAQALRSHLYNIDRLLQLQHSRLTCLEEGYSAQLEALKMELEAERRTILEQHERESCYLRDVALATEQNYAKNNHEATLNFQSARDDIKYKSQQEKQYSRLQLGGKVEVLWEQFQRAMQSYTEATEHQKIAFEALKQKDKKSSREIEMQAKKLQKLQDLVTATKGQIAAHLRESEKQNRHAREEKESVLRQLQELKNEMKQARAMAHGSLARLTTQSSAALKALARVVEKVRPAAHGQGKHQRGAAIPPHPALTCTPPSQAQHILRLAEMCRRLETEEEKVLPFYPSSLAEGDQREAQQVLEETPTEPLAQAMRDYVGLERFWQRFNKVKLEEQALEREQAALSQRNQHLRELLRQYLAGISVSQEVLSEPNALLIVERKSCVPADLPHAEGGHAQGHQSTKHPDSLSEGDAHPDPIHGSTGTS
ncbi:dynein regulatory complex subunit 2 isoform X1 [Buteo buteo]|uniref:dynein regulatory complex subunit 2 isoform X1 n=1 Tax=Buteo buteo TaxID=30397 RepID=UPI003EBD9BDD